MNIKKILLLIMILAIASAICISPGDLQPQKQQTKYTLTLVKKVAQ